jgi:hypothetical protein
MDGAAHLVRHHRTRQAKADRLVDLARMCMEAFHKGTRLTVRTDHQDRHKDRRMYYHRHQHPTISITRSPRVARASP